MNGALVTLGLVGAVATVGALRPEGSRATTPLDDVNDVRSSNEAGARAVRDRTLAQLPDGTRLSGKDRLDRYDDLDESALGALLFTGTRGAGAQRRLNRLRTWLEGFSFPQTVYRGVLLRVGETLRPDPAWHWTTDRAVATRFARGSDTGRSSPARAPAGHRAQVLQSQVLDPQEIDWVTSAYWFLGSDGVEAEVVPTETGARALAGRARPAR